MNAEFSLFCGKKNLKHEPYFHIMHIYFSIDIILMILKYLFSIYFHLHPNENSFIRYIFSINIGSFYTYQFNFENLISLCRFSITTR